ncbi:DNA-binding NarL/FixJ family response regulator [Rhodococcus sp. 27YEA15]|uniref:response regulator n=1 Tax=Rhodococcus sp. 27YEA15 TaxID=3156259 RepID=UPI003C7DD869
MSERVVRVVVADDQAVVRDGLVTILEHTPGIEVVGEAENGPRAIELAEDLRPEVVLMDLRMPGVDGASATAAIVAGSSGSKVLVLTTYADDESIASALRAGAAGYVTKSAGREQITSAIRATADGHRTFAPEVADLVLRGLDARASLERLARDRGLTPQEQNVLELIGKGMTNRAIAGALFVSVATVKTHVNNLFGKLHVTSRGEAAALLESTER